AFDEIYQRMLLTATFTPNVIEPRIFAIEKTVNLSGRKMQYRVFVVTCWNRCPMTRLHTPKPFHASASVDRPAVRLPNSSARDFLLKSSSRARTYPEGAPIPFRTKVHESTRMMPTSAGSLKNLASHGASTSSSRNRNTLI